MKRYLLFAGMTYYPLPGWEGFIGSFDTADQAQAEGEKRQNQTAFTDWWQVVDSTTGQIVVELES
jgi:hypothetical protein